MGGYTEDAAEYQDVVDRLLIKWETAKSLVPQPEVSYSKKNKIGIISIGSCNDAIREARDDMKKNGQSLNYLRVKAFPFSDKIEKFISQHEKVFVIEQNRDGQLHNMLITETDADSRKLESLRFYNGIPIFSKDIVKQIEDSINSGKAA